MGSREDILAKIEKETELQMMELENRVAKFKEPVRWKRYYSTQEKLDDGLTLNYFDVFLSIVMLESILDITLIFKPSIVRFFCVRISL